MCKKKIYNLLEKAYDNFNKKELLLAEHYAKTAYSLAIEVLESKSSTTSHSLHNIAFFYWLRKTFEKSIEYYKKSIKITSGLFESNDLASSINGLGYVYRSIGDYQKAVDFFVRAIEITINTDDTNLAAFYYDLARTQKIINHIKVSRKTYQKSINTAEKKIAKVDAENHKYYEQIIYYCYNDLAEIELNNSNLKQSKQYHQQALAVLENSKSNINTFFEGYKRFEIPAKIYIKEAQYDKAIEQLQKAKDTIVEEYQGFEVGKDLSNIIHQIGDCYIKLKQYDKALAAYQNALIAVCNTFKNEDINEVPAIEDIYNKRSAIASLSYKADVLLRIFKEDKDIDALERAYQTYQLIAQLIPITRRDYVEENSKFQLADETKNIYEKAIETCLNLYHLTKEETFLHRAFYFAESSKAIVLQENLQASYALEGMEESVQQQDIDYRSKIAFYENSINTNQTIEGNEAKIENWKGELFKCKQAYEDFLKQIEQDYPNYYTLKYAESISNVESLQKLLKTETALIEYFSGNANIYVFIITQNQFYVHTIKTDQAILEKDIKQFKQCIEQPDRSGSEAIFQTFKTLSHQLFQQVLQCSLSKLNTAPKNLIIVPDGLLYNIAFDALITDPVELKPAAFYSPKNLAYLPKQFAVSYNYSASLLLKTVSFQNTTKPTVFSGFAPAFDNLSNNQEEVKQIKDCLGGVTQLNEMANFDAFKLKATESTILHLSTHAKQSVENHKLSEIYFSDMHITNYHIENMTINAGLTVLSACETGAGFIQSGEGAMSLARSFFLAGCPSLVSSLWRADDESTADIMLYFYEYLKAGETKDLALQKAKLQYGEEAGIRESHPFYWAGFVQSGNRKALF